MSLTIQEQVPLAPLTTFKIGGPARYFVDIASEEDLQEGLAWAKQKNVPFVILAGGSNALISDDGFDGLVIHIHSSDFSFENTHVTALAGCTLLTVIKAASAQGLGGWEKMAGIPGTIGGAVRGNAGAFGTEVQDVLTMASALNVETGEAREFTNSECDFSYRHSFFKSHPEWVITQATFELLRTDAEGSIRLAQETIAEREKRHLQNVMAAGSYFMNPVAPQNIVDMFETEKNTTARENRVPAGWLIEKANMKGHAVGGAQASMQHPNYLINTGIATAADVRELANQIKVAVFELFGVQLKEEAAQM